MTDQEREELQRAIEEYAARHRLDPAPLIALLDACDAQPDALPEPADVRPQVLHRYPH